MMTTMVLSREFQFIERIEHLSELRVGETHRRVVAVADLALGLLIERAAGIRLAEDLVVRVKGDVRRVLGPRGGVDGGDVLAVIQVPVALRHLVRRVRLEEAEREEERLRLFRQRAQFLDGEVRGYGVKTRLVRHIAVFAERGPWRGSAATERRRASQALLRRAARATIRHASFLKSLRIAVAAQHLADAHGGVAVPHEPLRNGDRIRDADRRDTSSCSKCRANPAGARS